MKKFKVSVIRIAYSYKDIEVEANSVDEASEIALDTAGNYEFSSEKFSEYQEDGIEEITA